MEEVIIRIENLSKRFGDVKVLDNISLTIRAGEIFGIIGLSGAGKSTLVRCINFLERPTEGQVFFEGKNMEALYKKELLATRRSMGMVFQQFNLFMQRTALRNICYPLEIAGKPMKAAKKRAMELLELVGMTDKADAYPAQLSGGQRQRVAIARALATSPKVLLCDEATSALDPATTGEILELLADINKRFGTTIVVITHEMGVINKLCRRVAILDSSRVAETGPVDDVFTSPKTAAARRLIYPQGSQSISVIGKRCCRLVFDGNASSEPVLADLILKFSQKVNIMFADTRDIEGRAFGQMIIQLPEDERVCNQMLQYLNALEGIHTEEVEPLV